MKKIFAVILILSVMSAVSAFGNCGKTKPPSEEDVIPPAPPTFTPHESAEGIADRRALDEEKLVIFSLGGSDDFFWADGYSNGNEFNCTWRKSSAKIEDGIMSMSVKQEGSGYSGAEYRAKDFYSYGFYAVSMKAANCSGVISSFFTYTNKPVWDEIDIEFLGKDMTKVQFNYFTKGVGNHVYLLDLGYDASADFHEYAFDWRPDSITWYVDGKAVYRASGSGLPTNPMQIMMNVWNTRNADDWSGPLDKTALPATAQYEWFAYSSK